MASIIRREGGEAHFVQADVSRADDVEQLVAHTVLRYGRLDAAFNNAATEDGAFALTADFTEEQFERSISVNLKSVWLCMKQEIRQMLAQEGAGGAIVNTSSVNGLGGASGGSLYSAAKAGVLALTKSAAQEYAARGIRVIGQPEEAAAAVVWLCSDAASYVTGHSMIVDGGMTASTR